jgi:hypothetical protein
VKKYILLLCAFFVPVIMLGMEEGMSKTYLNPIIMKGIQNFVSDMCLLDSAAELFSTLQRVGLRSQADIDEFNKNNSAQSKEIGLAILAKAESFKSNEPDVMRELPELTVRKIFFSASLFELGAILFGAPIGYYLAVNDNVKYCAGVSLLGACALAVGTKCITTGRESAQKIYNKNAKPRENIKIMLWWADKFNTTKEIPPAKTSNPKPIPTNDQRSLGRQYWNLNNRKYSKGK